MSPAGNKLPPTNISLSEAREAVKRGLDGGNDQKPKRGTRPVRWPGFDPKPIKGGKVSRVREEWGACCRVCGYVETVMVTTGTGGGDAEANKKNDWSAGRPIHNFFKHRGWHFIEQKASRVRDPEKVTMPQSIEAEMKKYDHNADAPKFAGEQCWVCPACYDMMVRKPVMPPDLDKNHPIRRVI